MYGGSGTSPGRLAVESQPPAALAEVLEQLHRAVAPPRAQPARRPGEPLPDAVLAALEQQHLSLRLRDRDARGHHARVVDDDELVAQLLRELAEAPVPDLPVRPVEHEQPGLVAPLERPLRDQLGRQLVVQLRGLHPTARLVLRPMDQDAIERARQRLAEAAEGRTDASDVEAALERARKGLEDLAAAAGELEATLPAKVGEAVKEGVASEARPVGRQLAEVRGLMNQLLRRLERLEGDVLAERHARVDDLGLLVDLLTSGWKGVDERLARLEQHLQTGPAGAVVYRIEERRPASGE